MTLLLERASYQQVELPSDLYWNVDVFKKLYCYSTQSKVILFYFILFVNNHLWRVKETEGNVPVSIVLHGYKAKKNFQDCMKRGV